MILAQVPPEEIEEAWSIAAPLLAPAIEMGEEMSLEQALEHCHTRNMQLWLVAEDDNTLLGVFTTRLVEVENAKHCYVMHLGGKDMRKWGKEVTDLLAEWAKEAGCTKLLSQGRKGTERMYKDFGWEFDSVRMKRTL